jgi:predicted transcriptional regulator
MLGAFLGRSISLYSAIPRNSIVNNETDLTGLTVNIVSAYVTNNVITGENLPDFISAVHAAVVKASAGIVETPKAELKPAVPVKKSVTDDAIICLEDGKKFKSLKRHLQSVYGLSPEEYREKWGLTRDYPMVAPAYAAARSHLAKAIGLGRRPVEVAETPVKAAKATAKKSAAKAARK